jgi:hypothetical protein
VYRGGVPGRTVYRKKGKILIGGVSFTLSVTYQRGAEGGVLRTRSSLVRAREGANRRRTRRWGHERGNTIGGANKTRTERGYRTLVPCFGAPLSCECDNQHRVGACVRSPLEISMKQLSARRLSELARIVSERNPTKAEKIRSGVMLFAMRSTRNPGHIRLYATRCGNRQYGRNPPANSPEARMRIAFINQMIATF